MTDTTLHAPRTTATQTSANSRGLTIALFAAALLGFFLPFATVSCDTTVTFTGVQLATYSVPAVTADEREFAGEVQDSGSLPALLTLAAIVVGFGLFVLQKSGWGVSAVIGLLGLLFLPWDASLAFASFRVHEGYVLSTASLVGLATIGRIASVERRRATCRRVWPAIVAGLLLAVPVGLTTLLCASSGEGM